MNKLERAIESFAKKRVIIIGDLMLDLYTYGLVTRISPEAPVPVLRKSGEDYFPGGAANAANNLASLGVHVSVCGLIGLDQNGDKLLSLLQARGIDGRAIVRVKDYPTILKHRLVAGSHQLLRVDEEQSRSFEESDQDELLGWLEFLIGRFDAIILSDYAKGLFTEKLTSAIIKLGKQAGVLMVADIKPENKSLFRGVDLVMLNTAEAREMTGLKGVEEMGNELVKYFKADVVITKGEEGMSVFEKNGSFFDVPARKIEVFDVSGAGDTAAVVLTLGLISGMSLKEAAELANFAGGLVVQKPGTATVTCEELKAALSNLGHIGTIEVVPKLWGYEKWLENNDRYCSKILFLNKGYQSSLHYHKVKDEMFLVTKGHVRFEKDEEVLHMMPGSFVRIPPNTIHRFGGIEDSEILEISTHHSDKDSYRVSGEESRRINEPDGEINVFKTASLTQTQVVSSQIAPSKLVRKPKIKARKVKR